MTAATPGQATGLLAAQQPQPAPELAGASFTTVVNGEPVAVTEGTPPLVTDGAGAWPAVAAGAVHQAQELAERLAELRDLADEITRTFLPSGSGHVSRVGQVQITKWRKRAGLES